MLLVLDAGNTNVTVGLFDGLTLKHHFRMQTLSGRTADEYGVLCQALMANAGVVPKAVSGAAISSVVPVITGVLEEACRRYFHVEPHTVGPGTKTGMPLLVDNPREVGADRIVNAVAGWERFHAAQIIVDFGTATTFDAVSPRGEYLGGAICPGVGISMDALFRHAAKLPRVELQRPPKVVGKNTVHSMQSGLFWGYVALVDGIVERMVKEMDCGAVKVLATGGLAGMVGTESRAISLVDEHLTLDGLRILHERNRPRA